MQHLCQLDDIENLNCKGFLIGGVSIFVVRQNNKFFAYHNSCPHLGVPLEWFPDKFLNSDAELIQCSTHGALFLIDNGTCVSGPCQGSSLSPIALEIRGREIWIDALSAVLTNVRDPDSPSA